ncbi:hypothetical protein TRIUR3_19751 [Triticum urartu]|uniref:Uncharacterized protein n=1 Tax=Triticum urartu TaxID=4572 RepID=M7ZX16_TRIUA|nr:hypothetical protein TRIUR3_19751 [Triticum urartu]
MHSAAGWKIFVVAFSVSSVSVDQTLNENRSRIKARFPGVDWNPSPTTVRASVIMLPRHRREGFGTVLLVNTRRIASTIATVAVGEARRTASAWAELVGYVGSITIKLEEVTKMESSIKMRRAEGCGEENQAVTTMRGKLLLKRLSVVQDVADAFMALGDVTNGKGLLGSSTLTASAGLLSALISTHKNWNSC